MSERVSTPTPEPQGQDNLVNARVRTLQEAAGIELFDNDEELSCLVTDEDEATFLTSVADALKKKKARIQNQGNPKPVRQDLGNSKPTHSRFPDDMSANELWDRVEHKR